jgi:O-acetylserine/cysteine efflux transporter
MNIRCSTACWPCGQGSDGLLRPLHFLLALLLVMIWGTNFVVTQVALREMPPITLCFVRLFFSAFPAVFFVRRPALPWLRIASYGLPIFMLQFTFMFMALHAGLSPGLASVSLQLQAFFTIGLAVLFLGERPAWFQIFGACVALAGIVIIGAHGGRDVTLPGLLFAMLAALSWASGNIFSRLNGKVDMFAMVVWGSLTTLPPLFALALLTDGPARMTAAFTDITWLGAGAVAYLAYPALLGGYTFWSWLLQRYPTATVAPLSLMVPVAGMGASALLLGETIQAWKIGAAALVIGGFSLNMYGARLTALFRGGRA